MAKSLPPSCSFWHTFFLSLPLYQHPSLLSSSLLLLSVIPHVIASDPCLYVVPILQISLFSFQFSESDPVFPMRSKEVSFSLSSSSTISVSLSLSHSLTLTLSLSVPVILSLNPPLYTSQDHLGAVCVMKTSSFLRKEIAQNANLTDALLSLSESLSLSPTLPPSSPFTYQSRRLVLSACSSVLITSPSLSFLLPSFSRLLSPPLSALSHLLSSPFPSHTPPEYAVEWVKDVKTINFEISERDGGRRDKDSEEFWGAITEAELSSLLPLLSLSLSLDEWSDFREGICDAIRFLLFSANENVAWNVVTHRIVPFMENSFLNSPPLSLPPLFSLIPSFSDLQTDNFEFTLWISRSIVRLLTSYLSHSLSLDSSSFSLFPSLIIPLFRRRVTSVCECDTMVHLIQLTESIFSECRSDIFPDLYSFFEMICLTLSRDTQSIGCVTVSESDMSACVLSCGRAMEVRGAIFADFF